MSTPVNNHHAASYRAREVAAPTAVTDGVWAVPVPLFGSPLRSIIVYVLESSDGLVLVDAGYEHETCWQSFRSSLESIGLRAEDVAAVLVTHNHPDHVGFADRVRRTSGAAVMMHVEDDFARQAVARGGFLAQLERSLALTGAPSDVAATMFTEAKKVAHHAEDLRLDSALEGPETVLRFGDLTVRALHAPGHTYGHIVVVDDSRGLVFTGDTMMAEGPTQLAIPSLPSDDPARDLLATLDLIGGLGAKVACPAHQFAYTGVAERAARLRAHHAAEVDEVADLMRHHDTAWEIAPRRAQKKPWAEQGLGTKRFALVHTYALMRGAHGRAERA